MKWKSAIAIIVIIVLILFVQYLLPKTTGRPVQSDSSALPDSVGIVGYINTPPVNVSSFRGKVVLVDFWTYSCINCQRTLPYIQGWWEKYKDSGLVVLGMHTPEFEFEKILSNVERAVAKFGLTYPVLLDSNYATWNAFSNRYWPHKFLLDSTGKIRYDHIGEGGYEETERVIQELLAELPRSHVNKSSLLAPNASIPGLIGTPELYLGYAFQRGQLGNSEGWQPEKSVNYQFPLQLRPNMFYLGGMWHNNPDNMQAVANATLVLGYTSSKVFMVAGADGESSISVILDGMQRQNMSVQHEELYTLVNQEESGNHVLILKISPGVRVFTFTFG